jgi:hypothetical protein
MGTWGPGSFDDDMARDTDERTLRGFFSRNGGQKVEAKPQ